MAKPCPCGCGRLVRLGTGGFAKALVRLDQDAKVWLDVSGRYASQDNVDDESKQIVRRHSEQM